MRIKWSIFAGRKADEARARKYLRLIDGGLNWRDLGGRRMRHDRNVVSIPIGHRFRMLVDGEKNRVTWVGTHEAYNRTRPR